MAAVPAMASGVPEVPASEIARRRTFRNRWYRTPSFLAGGTIVLLLILASIAAPLITRYDPNAQDLLHAYGHPSSAHWLGTDQLGRDVFTRLVFAGRSDLLIGFVAVLCPFFLGSLLGSLAGFYGGFVDTVVMRLVDVVVAFPFLVLVIALVFVLGPGAESIIIAITAVGWVSYARIVRGEILVQKRLDYVLAARAAGLSDARIIGRHLLPNVITQAIVFSMSDIVLSILAIVTLGYLGLGLPPPTADWGSMASDGESLITTQWQLTTFPGLAVVLTGLGLSLLGDGLADLLAPEVSSTQPILSLRDLRVEIPTPRGVVKAVDGVSLDVPRGGSLGLVGESGCGKSMTLRAIMGLLPGAAQIAGGEVVFDGEALSPRSLGGLRGSSIGMVFQEPMTALNPVMRVGDQIAEGPRVRLGQSASQARERALELIRLVGIPDPERRFRAYPHELSGGLRQRIVIAIALASEPKLLLCDEPTTALDVTIQDQILHLLARLRGETGVSMVLVTHDLAVVAQTCERVAVMYAARIVETGTVAEVFGAPRHPYTRALLRSVPDFDERRAHLESIVGMPPDLIRPPSGCRFHPRCEIAHADCSEVDPALIQLGDRRATACRYHEELAQRA